MKDQYTFEFEREKAGQNVEEIEHRIDIQLKRKRFFIFKRCFDVLFSAFALILSLPLMLVIALLVYIDDPTGSPFFSQTRCGKNGSLFKMFKFRTMIVDAEAHLDELKELNERDGVVFKIKNDPRITRVGKFLRKSGLDEIPQFLNVFLGDMSVVGPRPPLPFEVAEYDDWWMLRLKVKPGMTCRWQVAPDRDSIPSAQWLEMDIDYTLHQSILGDLDIILKTVATVFRGDGH